MHTPYLKPVVFVCVLVISGLTAICQPVLFTKTPAVGVNLAFFDFNGADKLSSFGHYMKPGLAIHFQNNLNKRFDYSITLAGSFLQFPDKKDGNTTEGKKQLLVENDCTLRARLLKSPALFNPYVQAGAGWSQYDNQYGMYLPVGIGVQVNLTPDIFLLANSQYRVAVTALQHQHFFYSIGIAGTITRKKITQIKPVPLPGPVVKLLAPIDTDGDGIPDNLDSCPQVAGVIRYQGCPVPVKKVDSVATVQAPADVQAQATLNLVAQNILFETGSYRLLPGSFASLDTVAALLKDKPTFHLFIEGHTDNVGTVQSNQTLSENRANTVMQYLVKVGIDANRLHAAGYGQQRPVADNATEKGRSQNRRVVLTIHY